MTKPTRNAFPFANAAPQLPEDNFSRDWPSLGERPSPSADAKPIVYVVQECTDKNLKPAERYGRLRALLPQGSQIWLRPRDAMRQLETGLKDFRPVDFLLLVGDPAGIALTAIVASRNSNVINMLKWDRIQREYLVVEADVG